LILKLDLTSRSFYRRGGPRRMSSFFSKPGHQGGTPPHITAQRLPDCIVREMVNVGGDHGLAPVLARLSNAVRNDGFETDPDSSPLQVGEVQMIRSDRGGVAPPPLVNHFLRKQVLSERTPIQWGSWEWRHQCRRALAG